MAKYKIKIDKDACIGCGACVSIAEKLFGLEDGKAYAIKKEIADSELANAKEAADSCPVQAIKIEKS